MADCKYLWSSGTPNRVIEWLAIVVMLQFASRLTIYTIKIKTSTWVIMMVVKVNQKLWYYFCSKWVISCRNCQLLKIQDSTYFELNAAQNVTILHNICVARSHNTSQSHSGLPSVWDVHIFFTNTSSNFGSQTFHAKYHLIKYWTFHVPQGPD